MIIDVDNNLIAKWQTIDEILPYAQYKSGAKEGDKSVYQDKKDSSSNPVLALEFDILNKDGYGLKKGHYEIAVNEDYSFLMFVQAGTIIAKIPVVKQEVINEYGSNFEWSDNKNKNAPNSASKNLEGEIPVSSKQIYKQPMTDKEIKKRKEQYKKGQDPKEYFHSKVYIEYVMEHALYKVVWEKYNTRLTGVIKVSD